MSTKAERKTTYKVVNKETGAIVNIYEGKSSSGVAKQHLESLGHEVSVANSGEVFSFLKGQRDLFRDNQGPQVVTPTVTTSGP